MASAEPAPAGAGAAQGELRITVAYSPQPGEVDIRELRLPVGSCVDDALRASGLVARHPQLDLGHAALGVWGALCDARHVLRDRDRVEVYRPLRVDPKEARRRREEQQRERAAAARKAKRR